VGKLKTVSIELNVENKCWFVSLFPLMGLMGEKGLMEEDWNDRGNWRKKIL
jgi:hypothetical protein